MKALLKILLISAVFSLCSSITFAKPVTSDQVRKTAGTFLKAEQANQQAFAKYSVEADATMVAEAITLPPDYTLGETKEIIGDNGTILAYVTELEPEGFIINSADTDIRPVLGYSFEGTFPFEDFKENTLLHLVQWDVQARLKVLSEEPDIMQARVESNNDSWVSYASSDENLVQAVESVSQWGPWITTRWHQGGHYNDYCPLQSPSSTDRCVVGCVATAMSQIVNYWQFPPSLNFDSNDNYDSPGTWPYDNVGLIHIPSDSILYNFPSFNELNTELSTINYNGNLNEEAYLCFAAGVKLGMDYGTQSGTDTGVVASVLRNDFSYGSAIKHSERSGVWSQYSDEAIENLKKGWPVQIAIHQSGQRGGHSVVVDGYRDSDDFFHVNFGWGITEPETTIWYALPQSYGAYDVVHTIVYDIYSSQGWNQYGADECNSQLTVYDIPTDVEETDWDKWHRSTERSRYQFRGMVVGAGNKAYASVESMDHNDGDPSYVYVIDQHGSLEEEIVISDADDGLNYPIQLPEGTVFVTSRDGGLYKIDPKTNTKEKTYSLPSSLPVRGFDDPLKYDDDNCLYAVVGSKYAIDGDWLYSFTKDGDERGSSWPFQTPSNCDIWTPPAIDTDRNSVYLSYLNDSTYTGYLVKLNRTTGAVINTRSFPNVTAVGSVGTPSVGPDGTVYVAFYTTLYAFNPDLTSIIWQKDIYPGFCGNAPTIAHDHLYVARWKNVGGPWTYVVEARRPSDGNVVWEIPFTLNSYSNISGQILAGANSTIAFTIHNDAAESFMLYGYEDAGTSYFKKWEQAYPSGEAGDIAIGAGDTLYVLGRYQITAVSQGERGDADGAGMGFADNVAPNTPYNPSPIDSTTDLGSSVTLSWACSDPDAHDIKYDVFVRESGYEDMVPIATGIPEQSFTLNNLTPGSDYIWKVVATDGQAMTEGPKWTFSTASENVLLSVSSSGANGVAISSNTGHGGTTDYTRIVNDGTQVCLTAPIIPCMAFIGWTGAVTSPSQSICLTMDADKSLIANYVPTMYTVSVSSLGTSSVPISSSTGYGGTTDYNMEVSCGTTVTLTAPILSGKTFTGWTGSITSSNQTISLSMNANKFITANYQTTTPTLLSISISGSTQVNENSSAQYTATADYSDGSTANVTSSASWTENSSYASISGSGYLKTSSVSSDQSCTITVTYGGKSDTHTITIKDSAASANTLSVSSSGASSVAITSMTGFGGTTNYTRSVADGSLVILTAPATDSGGATFTGWTGSVSSSSPTVWFKMNASKSVTANYSDGTRKHTLSVNAYGASSVGISSPTGQGGTTNYTKIVNEGNTVTLTAPVLSGQTFTGWTGSAGSTNRTISFTMNANKTVTANYETVTGCVPSSVSVDSIVPGTQRGSRGRRFGKVTVKVLDNCGNAVANAVVYGTFTGDYSDTLTATTNASGVATFKTTTEAKKPTFVFCVDSVGSSLPYNPNDNIETCDTY